MQLTQLYTHSISGFRRYTPLLMVDALAVACGSPVGLRSTPGLQVNTSTRPATQAPIEQTFGQLPLYFVENRGQTDERVAYYIQGSDKTLYFTPDGVTFALTRSDIAVSDQRSRTAVGNPQIRDDARERLTTPPYSRWAVKLDFVDANPNVRPIAQGQAEAVISYFKGQPDVWHTGLRTYHRLIYPDLWPGIDLVYYGTVNQLKYEFIVRPGADPAQIRLTYRGATDVRLNDDGQLEVTTPLGGLTDDVPVAYQDIEGERVPVSMAYALEEPSPLARLTQPSHEAVNHSQSYGFHIDAYDPTRPLVLDPAVLIYAGYIGGSGDDRATNIAVDDTGNVYVTGSTTSDQTTFPVTGGPDLSHNGLSDVFLVKVNATGTALVYAGYVGGDGIEQGVGIEVDSAENVYIAGLTTSDETTFPVTGGPDLSYNDSGPFYTGDAFVAKLSATGTALVYAGYVGGAGQEYGWDIALDGADNAYITGFTRSDETTFPVTGGPDLTYNDSTSLGYDAFVAKVNITGTALVYAGYIGGAGLDYGWGIAVDSDGNAYIMGATQSDETTFPVIGGPDLTYNGGISNGDAFVVKVNTAGTALVYAGYIGGAGDDRGYGILVDGTGNVYVTGDTQSDETTFPAMVGPDLTYNGGVDAFVAKINPAGTALIYAGYIGGSGYEFGYRLAMDGIGNTYISGGTSSDETTFPVTGGPDLTYNGGSGPYDSSDAFVAKINMTGTALIYAGYIGGSDYDIGFGVAVDGAGNAYVSGYTTSDQTTFPAIGGPDLTHNGGIHDAFVAKVLELNNQLYLPVLHR